MKLYQCPEPEKITQRRIMTLSLLVVCFGLVQFLLLVWFGLGFWGVFLVFFVFIDQFVAQREIHVQYKFKYI